MDCMTISTFRSLEQQAIRQFEERKVKESAYKGVQSMLLENVIPKQKSSEKDVKTTNKGNIDFYA